HRELTFECEGTAMLSAITRAVEMAKLSGDVRLLKIAQLRRVNALQLLGHLDEAAQALEEVGPISEDDDALLRSHYLMAHACTAGIDVNAETAYGQFDAALELISEEWDPCRAATIWNAYGYMA